MKVILTKTIETLGIIGSEVKVAKGYARNYLLPQEMAVLSTPANRKRLEFEKKRFEIQIAKEKRHCRGNGQAFGGRLLHHRRQGQ